MARLPGGSATPLRPATRRAALELAGSDPTLLRLLHGSTFRLASAQQWGVGLPLRGAALRLALARPIAVDADLPRADIPPDAPATGVCREPYRQTWLHERSRGSGTLSLVKGRPHPSCTEIPSGGG